MLTNIYAACRRMFTPLNILFRCQSNAVLEPGKVPVLPFPRDRSYLSAGLPLSTPPKNSCTLPPRIGTDPALVPPQPVGEIGCAPASARYAEDGVPSWKTCIADCIPYCSRSSE